MSVYRYSPFFEYIHMKKDYDGSEIVNDCIAIIKQYKEQLSFFHSSAPIFYLYNFITDRYIIISHSLDVLLGYSSTYVMDSGAHELGSYLKREDINAYNTRVFPENFRILTSVIAANPKEYVFTTNYRIRNRRGDILAFMEKYMYIHCTPEGFPLISLGFAYDITDIKSDSKIVHTVKHVNPNTGLSNEDYILKNYYFLNEKDGDLTKRELEVLKWTCEGLASKEIAEKLFISLNTIHNHKKNMREKTNCKNTLELLNYAVKNNYL